MFAALSMALSGAEIFSCETKVRITHRIPTARQRSAAVGVAHDAAAPVEPGCVGTRQRRPDERTEPAEKRVEVSRRASRDIAPPATGGSAFGS